MSNLDTYVNEENEYNRIINSNPFVYEKINEQYVGLSFDDYIVNYKGASVKFSDIITNPTIDYKERVKFTKNQMNFWEEEYKTIKNNKFNELIEKVKQNTNENIKKASTSYTLVLFIIILLITALNYFAKFVADIFTKINLEVVSNKILLLDQDFISKGNTYKLNIILIFAFFVMYAYLFFFNMQTKRGQTYLKKLRRILKARNKRLDLKTKKASKKAVNYYIKVAKNETSYKPLLISSVQLDFTIGNTSDNIDKKILQIVKSNKYLGVLQYIVYLFRFAIVALIIAYGVLFYLL